MKTIEEVQKLAADSANIHFNMKHEGDWYAHYYGYIYGYQQAEQHCKQHGVVRPEVESAKEGELLGNVVGKGVRVGSYYCIRKDHKDSVCLKQCDWCKSVSGKH